MGCAAALEVDSGLQERVLMSVPTATSQGPTAMVLETSWRPPAASWLSCSSGTIFLQPTGRAGRRFQPLLRQHQGSWMPPSSQEHIPSIAPAWQHVSHRMAPSISPLKAWRQFLCVPRELPYLLTPQTSTLLGHRPRARQPNTTADSHRRNNTQTASTRKYLNVRLLLPAQTSSACLTPCYFMENIPFCLLLTQVNKTTHLWWNKNLATFNIYYKFVQKANVTFPWPAPRSLVGHLRNFLPISTEFAVFVKGQICLILVVFIFCSKQYFSLSWALFLLLFFLFYLPLLLKYGSVGSVLHSSG